VAQAARVPDEARGQSRGVDQEDQGVVRGVRRHGSPRITLDLWAEGRRVSRNTVAEIMAEHGWYGREPKKRRSLIRQGKRKAARDLVGRRFDAVAPDVYRDRHR
jgi:hypothetical protein